MGSGAPRQDEKEAVPARDLTPQINSALHKALQRLDALNPAFKGSREEERDSQLSKAWSAKCREIAGYLQAIAQTMLSTHQLSLDMGSDGGGRGMRPWMEETTGTLDRLYFRLENSEVVATLNDMELLRGPLSRVSYEWIEEAVINWVLSAVEAKTGRGA